MILHTKDYRLLVSPNFQHYLKQKGGGVLSLVPLVEALAKPILNRTSNAEAHAVRLYKQRVNNNRAYK